MTLPTFVGTIPGNVSAPQVRSYINNSFLALYSKCLSPTPPEDPIAGMEWLNSGTGVLSVRDPQGVAWVPIGKFEAQSWIPFVATGGSTGGGTGGGEDSSLLGPYASLAAGEGFAGGSAGEVFVRKIVASDLPTFTPSAAGIVPAPTASQSGAVLRPSGWSPLFQDFGAKTFAGQSSYVWSGFPPVSQLRCVWEITMPASRVAVVQIGSGGAPKTSGYDASSIAIEKGLDAYTATEGFDLWRDIWDLPSITVKGTFDITEISTNSYFFNGFARTSGGPNLHHQMGIVTLTGPMNYLRILSSGATPVNFTAGRARIFGG